jgi:predicted transcriptional regulator
MTRHLDHSRRERQIMEIIYRLGTASAAEVRAALPDPPSYSAVRATLSLLVDKGHLRHRRDGRRYLYSPVVGPTRARQSALRSLLRTFFEDSVEQAVASLLDLESLRLDDEDFDRLEVLIEEARRKGGEA